MLLTDWDFFKNGLLKTVTWCDSHMAMPLRLHFAKDKHFFWQVVINYPYCDTVSAFLSCPFIVSLMHAALQLHNLKRMFCYAMQGCHRSCVRWHLGSVTWLSQFPHFVQTTFSVFPFPPFCPEFIFCHTQVFCQIKRMRFMPMWW